MTIVALEVGSPRTSKDMSGKDSNRYGETTIPGIIRERVGWLVVFFFGLLIAAFVVEGFEQVLKEHVELSYFVPLLIGQGGNTGAQSNATIIRALALGHIRPSDYLMVVRKEAVAGGTMGAMLGFMIFGCSFLWRGLPRGVALTVAISLPVVSMWANILGGLLPLLSTFLGHNPAVTSAPLMTTVVDATGLAIYLEIAKLVMGI